MEHSRSQGQDTSSSAPSLHYANCRYCGTELEGRRRELGDTCSECERLSRGIDALMKRSASGAMDLLHAKLARLSKARRRRQDVLRSKSKPPIEIELPEPVSEAPATLRAIVVSVSGRNRLNYRHVSGGRHIRVLDPIEFQQLERREGAFLCQHSPKYNHIYEPEDMREPDCKKCLERRESLQRRGIEVDLLSKSEAQALREKRDSRFLSGLAG